MYYEELDEDTGEYEGQHDWDLDTGCDTAEGAIDKLYKLVLDKFGEYEEED